MDTWNVQSKFPHPVDDGDGHDLPPLPMRTTLQANHVSYADPVFRSIVVCKVCLTPHAGWGWLIVMSLPAKIRYLVPDI